MFYFTQPLTPIITHDIPYHPITNWVGRGGGMRRPTQVQIPAPSVGMPLGEYRGAVLVHAREQGRPEGAGFLSRPLSFGAPRGGGYRGPSPPFVLNSPP